MLILWAKSRLDDAAIFALLSFSSFDDCRVMGLVRLIFPKLAQRLLPNEVAKLRTALEAFDCDASLPDNLILALIVAEDRRFKGHSGFDALALARAGRNYFLRGKRGGGSTIEQQFSRTLTQRYEKSIGRKATEILLAAWISQHLTKRQIAEGYLNVAYFGWRMTGLRAAAQRLRLDLRDLSDRDAAFLVAALKYPFPRDPTSERLKRLYMRQRHILTLMKSFEECQPNPESTR